MSVSPEEVFSRQYEVLTCGRAKQKPCNDLRKRHALIGSPAFWSCDRINISMLNTNTNLILTVSLLSGNKVMIVHFGLKLNLPPMTYLDHSTAWHAKNRNLLLL